MLRILFIILAISLLHLNVFAGCTPASPGATACAACDAADGQTITATKCYSGGATTFANFTINSGGTLRVCGTLTITSLTLGAGTTAIVVESGGSLTITNALTCTATNTITNRGTLVFTGTVGMDATTTIVNDISTATMTFSANLTSSVGKIVNRGTINFEGVVTFSGSATYCPEASVANFNWPAAWTATLSGTPFSSYAGGAGSYAVLNFANQCSISGSVFPAEYHICNTTAFSNYNAGSMGGTSSGAAACSFPPLPVVLLSFTAKSNTNSVDLAWVTAQEFNNDHFELERSQDGINFEKVVNVKGQGTKSTSSSYLFNDSEVNMLLPIYYRLKQVDFDNQFFYSNVIVLNGAEGNTSIDIYPNPIEEGTTLYARFGQEDEGMANILLFDLSGKLIHEYTMDNVTPGGIYAIEDKSLLLVEGSYLLQIRTSQHLYHQKLVVK